MPTATLPVAGAQRHHRLRGLHRGGRGRLRAGLDDAGLHHAGAVPLQLRRAGMLEWRGARESADYIRAARGAAPPRRGDGRALQVIALSRAIDGPCSASRARRSHARALGADRRRLQRALGQPVGDPHRGDLPVVLEHHFRVPCRGGSRPGDRGSWRSYYLVSGIRRRARRPGSASARGAWRVGQRGRLNSDMSQIARRHLRAGSGGNSVCRIVGRHRR